jgi:YD repeat-containing protein
LLESNDASVCDESDAYSVIVKRQQTVQFNKPIYCRVRNDLAQRQEYALKLKHMLLSLLAVPAIGMADINTRSDGSSPPCQGTVDHAGNNDATRNSRNRPGSEVDDKGRIIRQTDKTGGITEYIYHPRIGKLILVLSDRRRSEFHYDDQAKLIRAEDSTGRVIRMEYGDTGDPTLIKRMFEGDSVNKRRHELAFKYNAAGKPTEITLIGTGKITVAYDDHGEISKVASKQSARMALQVTLVFQNLLRVISVADFSCSGG